MEANELKKNVQLRNGNIVLAKGELKTIDGVLRGHVCLVEDITDDGSFGIMYGGWVDLDDIEFVLLTEEWLLTFGFELDHSKQSWYHRTFVKGDFEVEELVGDYGYDRAKLRYVHQLQNLYFALTGQELTIK